HSKYPEWYENYDVSPKIRIDGNKLDFVKNPEDLQHVLDTIDSELQKLDLL
ncbi:TPA: deoxynucleoside kinase, partial [Streptococcus agalactiae]